MNDEPAFQVVMIEAIRPSFEAWLSQRGLKLVRAPNLDSPDDLPIYIIGISFEPPIAPECRDTDGDGDCPLCVRGRWRCPKKVHEPYNQGHNSGVGI